MPGAWRVCIVGAGAVSGVHGAALRSLPGIEVTAVVDPHLASARRLAKTCGIDAAYADSSEVLAKRLCDVAHILVPPPLHAEVALSYIRAGCHVLIEKPMCLSVKEADTLKREAQERGVKIGVNHNVCFNLAHLKAKKIVESNRLGKIHHVYCQWNADLPPLSRKKYNHWMFESLPNIFFEQASHPLSQIYDLVGAVRSSGALTREPMRLAPGIDFIDTWQVSMICERATAQLFYSLGHEFPSRAMVIICENGAISMNTMRNTVLVETSPRGLSFADYHTARAIGRQAAQQGRESLFEELKAKLAGRPAANEYTSNMRDCIGAFYRGLESGRVPIDADFGTEVVRMCERVVEGLALPKPSPAVARPPRTEPAAPADVAVFGGTGQIGRHVVARLVEAGMRVNVMARSARGLPEIFSNHLVRCIPGDIANPEAVDRVIGDAPYVIDLAYSAGDNTWEYMEEFGVGGARNVAECCLRKQVKRLVYTSTAGVMDMSRPGRTLRDSTPPDPKFRVRNPYARMKAVCERMLIDMHREKGLRVCVLRPGVVIGEDNYPYHGGVARFYNKQHAVCPSRGTNKLPFVLVKDVAEAYYLALVRPGVEGKSYNLVGDVRLTAREYVAELARAFDRPIAFVPVPTWRLKAEALAKWVVKLACGRASPFPDLHEIACWGLYGKVDNQEIKNDLGWRPVADRATFIREGIEICRKATR